MSFDLYMMNPHGDPGRDADDDARTIRDRQAAIDRQIDLAPPAPRSGCDRRLVSIFDAGKMPDQPDRFYAAHPVVLNGPSREGGTASPWIDTLTTMYVDVLRAAPQAGDILVATAVGGRWVAEVDGGHCKSTVCLGACNGTPVYGATVNVLAGDGTILATCTTNTNGCCNLNVCGHRVVQVIVSGQVVYQATRNLSGTILIELGSNAGLVCCGGYLIPTVLTVTDAEGSTAFVYDPNYFYPLWTGGHSVTRTSSIVTTPNNVCIVHPPSQGPVRVCYQMICHAGQNPTFGIQRSWSWVYQQGTLTPIWLQDPQGFAPGQFCITAPPAICGNPLTDTASFGANPTSTVPFVLTGTPVAALSNATTDPVGGAITISA